MKHLIKNQKFLIKKFSPLKAVIKNKLITNITLTTKTLIY